MKSTRAEALDLLRGAAVLLMILSGTIPFGGSGQLPAWMYHAQVPPPGHIFNPAVPGITWVDLVFPFFLFSMGMAFPFALNRRIEKQGFNYKVFLHVLGRGLLLAAFAIYIQHIKPYAISPSPDASVWLLSLLGFLLLFPILLRLPDSLTDNTRYLIKAAGTAAAVILLVLVRYPEGKAFSLNRSDIIILVLANTAAAGGIVWLLTRRHIMPRLLILVFLLAVRLTHNIDGSWNQALWNFSPFPWLYKFYYLQYLFIVIPGSIAGDIIYDALKNKQRSTLPSGLSAVSLPLLLTALPVINLICLYGRFININLAANIILLGLGYLIIKKQDAAYQKLFQLAAALILLGLSFEAFEGGIKKDQSTLSYYLLTGGLAVTVYMLFDILIKVYNARRPLSLLDASGQNPMIAYVAVSLFITPVFSLTGINSFLAFMSADPWLGFAKGLLFTLLTALTAYFFTKKRLYWRT